MDNSFLFTWKRFFALTSINFLLATLLSAPFLAGAYSGTDAPEWARSSVDEACERKLIDCLLESNFSEPLTRATGYQMLTKGFQLYSASAKSSFTDVSGEWFEQAAHTAFTLQWSVGKDGKFLPADYFTRAQIAVALSTILGLETFDENGLDVYVDKNEVPPWGIEQMKKAVKAKLIGQGRNDRLRPKDPVTKLEAIVILNAAVSYAKNKNVKPLEVAAQKQGVTTAVLQQALDTGKNIVGGQLIAVGEKQREQMSPSIGSQQTGGQQISTQQPQGTTTQPAVTSGGTTTIQTTSPMAKTLDLGVTDSYDKYVDLSSTAREGIKRYNIYIPWKDIEPTLGTYSWTTLDQNIQKLKENGMRTGIEIELTDVSCTNVDKTDQECVGKFLPVSFSRTTSSFDSQEFINNLPKLVKAIMQRYEPTVVTHVFLGNETNTVLNILKKATGRDFFTGFSNLIKKTQEEVNILPQPRAKFGTIFTFWGFGEPVYSNQPHQLMSTANIDTMGFTIYPTDTDLGESGIMKDIIKKFLDKLISLGGGKPIAITEIGHPVAPPAIVGATPEGQKEFAQHVVDYFREHRSSIDFVSWFSMYDNTKLPNTIYTSSGLKSNLDVKRPAFDVWAQK